MKRTIRAPLSTVVAAIVILAMAVPLAHADIEARIEISKRPYNDLQVWIWPDRGEGASYLPGDNIRINVEVNRSSYLILYGIDTRGNLRILFPNDPWDDNFVPAGEVVSFPRPWDGYDWTVDGPAGTEYVQAIASEFPIHLPDWPVYLNSVNHGGSVSFDPDLRDFRSGRDRFDYIRTVNYKIAGRYWDWTATDLTSFEVRPRYYYRTWYSPDPWPDVFYGEIYIGWPIGGRIYIDDFYVGIAPLWIPRRYGHGQHVVVSRLGHRVVRRQTVHFYPKRKFRFDTHRYNRRVVIDNGHVKSGRRGGQEHFRTEITRERRVLDTRRGRKSGVVGNAKRRTGVSDVRKTTVTRERSRTVERTGRGQRVTTSREASRSVAINRPAPKIATSSKRTLDRSHSIERSSKVKATAKGRKVKKSKSLKRPVLAAHKPEGKVAKAKAAKKTKVFKKRSGESGKGKAKVSKKKRTGKNRTRATTGKRRY